jgi:hypothetical protein
LEKQVIIGLFAFGAGMGDSATSEFCNK